MMFTSARAAAALRSLLPLRPAAPVLRSVSPDPTPRERAERAAARSLMAAAAADLGL